MELVRDSFVDLVFLQRMIYIMQLKYYGLEDKVVIEAIEALFIGERQQPKIKMLTSISSFVYCFQDDSKQPSSNENIAVTSLETLKGQIIFEIQFSLIGIGSNIDHSLEVVFENGKGEKIGGTGQMKMADFQFDRNIPNPYSSVSICIRFKGITTEKGIYMTKIVMDRQLIGAYPVYMKDEQEKENEIINHGPNIIEVECVGYTKKR